MWAVIVLSAASLLASRAAAEAPPIYYGPCFPAAKPGPARHYEAEIDVSTYSSANAVNRNLLTVIPLVSWSGVGPDVSMNLYHNSGAVGSTLDLVGPAGIDLGPGWSLSFGTHLIEDQTGQTITIIYDDGRQDVFSWDGFQWVPPVGVHDLLAGAKQLGFVLTHKDQSYLRFHSFNLNLEAIGDGLGNEITLTYGGAPSRLEYITDASGRQIQFGVPEHGGSLGDITDPKESGDVGGYIDDRQWSFFYNTNGRLETIRDPMTYEIDITYDAAGRIHEISDKHLSAEQDPPTYTYTYHTNWDENAVETIVDPRGMTQSFDTVCVDEIGNATTYNDRGDHDWVYNSMREAPTFGMPNGPLRSIDNPYSTESSDPSEPSFVERVSFNYDADRNMTEFIDALQNTWTYTYDSSGNLLTAQSPLHDPPYYWYLEEWTYDAYNNVTSYENPAGPTITYHYDISGYPTLLSSIVEPEVVTGGGMATTTFDYYLSNPPYSDPPEKNGLLKQVTDPNNVITAFDYDQWGQEHYYREGYDGANYVYEQSMEIDSGSRPHVVAYANPGRASRGGGSMRWNANNHATSSSCNAARSGSPDFPPPPSAPAIPSCAPFIPEGNYGEWTATYSPRGELKTMNTTLNIQQTAYGRDFTYDYDPLGQTTLSRITSSEEDAPTVGREFNYDMVVTGGVFTGVITRDGPDGMRTTYTLDEANRLERIERRIPSGSILMEANYSYYANGLLQTVTYGNGVVTTYTYDDAGRLETAVTRDGPDPTDTLLDKLTYEYDNRGLVTSLGEQTAPMAVPIFDSYEYDNRGRLTRETRGSVRFATRDWTYEYDQGGNRTKKIITVDLGMQSPREIQYEYDYTDVQTYQSANNRLMWYATYDTSGQSSTLLSTTYYYYNDVGNVTRVVTAEENPPPGQRKYTASRMVYAKNGQTVAYVIGEAWDDGIPCTDNYDILYAKEFRYDGARQRYLSRALNPSRLEDGVIESLTGQVIWSDYDGDGIYGDFRVSGGVATQEADYEPGVGRSYSPGVASATMYYHQDLLGSTRMMTNASQSQLERQWYSAFGESGNAQVSQRYGYAGSWGYQRDTAADGFPFMHVGARYYDPATGRFLQRDPIGIRGGMNVYEYVHSSPFADVDPSGLLSSLNPITLAEAGFTIQEIADMLGMTVACVAAAVGTTAAQTKVERERHIGPSGKPKIHRKRHPTRKRAEDAARREGRRKPIHHPSPKKGRPHFHPADGEGNKVPHSTHHEYPAKVRIGF